MVCAWGPAPSLPGGHFAALCLSPLLCKKVAGLSQGSPWGPKEPTCASAPHSASLCLFPPTLCRCGRRATVPTEARVLTPATCEYDIFQEQGAVRV